MTLEQEKLRDIENINKEIIELEAQKQKVKDLLVIHANKNLSSKQTFELSEMANKKRENIDNLISSKRIEIEKIKNIGEEKNNMNDSIVFEKEVKHNLTRKELSYQAGIAAAKVIMAHRGINQTLNEVETFALLKFNKEENIKKFTSGRISFAKADGDQVTTTSDVFVAATDTLLGQNNGGVFINTRVLYDLLEVDSYESAFLRDVRKKEIADLLKFPYQEDTTGAIWVDELDCGEDEANKYNYIELGRNGLQKFVKITWELSKMAAEELLRHILEEIRAAMDDALSFSVIYGKGKSATETIGTKTYKRPQPYGAAYQSTTSDKTGESAVKKVIGTTGDYKNAMEALEKAPLDLFALGGRRAIRGAKYYVSMAFYNDFFNAKDSNGDRVFGVTEQPKMFGNYPILIDEVLQGKDFIFGNAYNYILNEIAPIMLYSDQNIKCRINEYAAFGMFDGKGIPKSFIYGSDSTTARDAMSPAIKSFRTTVNAGKNQSVIE